MFLNYIAGFVSFILAISAFTPWMTFWVYSLKGIESFLGIIVLLLGFFGVFISIFQHLSGVVRGRGFMIVAILSVVAQAGYFKKISDFSDRLMEVIGLVKDLFGETLTRKLQENAGDPWVVMLNKLFARFAPETSVDWVDFLGGGLVVSLVAALLLLGIGGILETRKENAE